MEILIMGLLIAAVIIFLFDLALTVIYIYWRINVYIPDYLPDIKELRKTDHMETCYVLIWVLPVVCLLLSIPAIVCLLI